MHIKDTLLLMGKCPCPETLDQGIVVCVPEPSVDMGMEVIETSDPPPPLSPNGKE